MRKLVSACLLLIAILSGCITNVTNTYRPGWDYYREGEVEKAVQHFQGTYTALCKIYSETGQYEKAVKSCEEALQKWQPIRRTDYKDINELLEDGLFFEGKAVWVGRLSDAYEHTGQIGRAIEVMKQWVTADNPNDSGGFAKLSALYIANKQYDEAITAAKRAIELKPDNANAYNDLGIAYSHKKQFDEALNAHQKAIEIEPKNATLYTNIGNLFLQREDYSRAADNYKKAAVLTPNDTRPLFALANTYRQMGRYDEAIEAANKAVALMTITGVGLGIAIKGDYPVVQRQIVGESGLIEGPAKRAGIEAGDKIIKINGQSTKGWDLDKVIQNVKGSEGTQVVLTIERKNFDKPIEKTIIRETIIFKGAAPLFGLRSLAYREKGNLEYAFKDAEKAYSLDPNDRWAKSAMSIAYIDKGQYN
ncbi:MAG: tetratricopeptide repeat protein, partial [Proteobacteria bacterium]|nr:tetratricopeptide repeat protein [Pseudomonadota bacterium]